MIVYKPRSAGEACGARPAVFSELLPSFADRLAMTRCTHDDELEQVDSTGFALARAQTLADAFVQAMVDQLMLIEKN